MSIELNNIINEISQVAQTNTYVSEGFEVAKHIVFINGINELISITVMAVLVVLLYKYVLKADSKLYKNLITDKDLQFVIKLIVVISCVVLVLAIIMTIFDVWFWASLFDQELYLAHEILSKIL